MPVPSNLEPLEVAFRGGYFPSAPDIPPSDFLGTIRRGSNVWVRSRGKIEVAKGLLEISSTNVGARIFAADIQRATIAGGLIGNRLPFAGLLRYNNFALFFLSENTSAQVYLNEVAVTGLTTATAPGRLRVAIPNGAGGYNTFDAGFDKPPLGLGSGGVTVQTADPVGAKPMIPPFGVAVARWRSATNAVGPPSDLVRLEPPQTSTIRVEIDLDVVTAVSGQDGWVFAGTRWNDESGELRVVRYVYLQPRGTFTATNGSNQLTLGVGTFWTLDLRPADQVRIDGTIYTITAIAGDATATINTNFTGTTNPGKTMTMKIMSASWYDGELRGLVSRDVFKPPRAAGVLKYAGRVFLWGVPDTNLAAPTNPTGNVLVAMADDNPEQASAFAIATDSGSDLVNALPVEGAIFLMTTTGLEIVTFTGDPSAPYKIRVVAEPGFIATTNGVTDGDTFYGFNGAPLRTKANGNIEVEFGEPVLDIMKLWNPQGVKLAVDPKNRAVLYIHDDGATTTVLPFMTQFGVWGSELNFGARILDGQVVNGKLDVTFLSGGNIRVNEWEGGAGIGGSPYTGSQYIDANFLNRNRLKNIAFVGKAGMLRVYVAAPDAAVPDISNPAAATASFALSDIDKVEPEISTNIEGKAFALRIEFPSADGNIDKLVIRGIPKTERR